MLKGYVLIDGNNIAHAANHAMTLSAGGQPTQAVYGTIRILHTLSKFYRILAPVVLWDGRSWRYDVFDEYKAARNKIPTTKQEIEVAERRKQLALQMPTIREAIRLLGITQVSTMNLEADDLAGILSRRYSAAGKRTLLVSRDYDWLQLVDKNTNWFDPIKGLRADVATFKALTAKLTDTEGVADGKAWLDVKCLMGDSSDTISGVGGIGPKGAVELVNTYGSCETFIQDAALYNIKLPKKFEALARDLDKQEIYHRNRRLMDLTSNEIPKPQRLKSERAPFDSDAFEVFCKKHAFNSFLKEYETWRAPFETIP